jgi:hypothetical protein
MEEESTIPFVTIKSPDHTDIDRSKITLFQYISFAVAELKNYRIVQSTEEAATFTFHMCKNIATLNNIKKATSISFDSNTREIKIELHHTSTPTIKKTEETCTVTIQIVTTSSRK